MTKLLHAMSFASRKSFAAQQLNSKKNNQPQIITSKNDLTSIRQRYNFASINCSANAIAYHAVIKSPNSVLNDSKESYLSINLPNSAARSTYLPHEHPFLIIELCQEVKIEYFVLGNFEFYSNMLRQFEIYTSESYLGQNGASSRWMRLGKFAAEDVREIQMFHVKGTCKIFAKYLKIVFISFYGRESSCKLTFFKVFGKNMMDDYKEEMKCAPTILPKPTPTPNVAFNSNDSGNIYKKLAQRISILEERLHNSQQYVDFFTQNNHSIGRFNNGSFLQSFEISKYFFVLLFGLQFLLIVIILLKVFKPFRR